MAKTYQLELDENELKMLLVAIRQVQNTFTIAETQSSAAGEPLAADYTPIQEAYERLREKVVAVMPPQAPYRVK